MEEHYKEDWRSLDLNLGSLREIYNNIYSAPTKTSNATVNGEQAFDKQFLCHVFFNCRLLACELYGNNAEL